MLSIVANREEVQSVSTIHFETVRCVIRKRIGSKLRCKKACNVCSSKLEKRKSVPLEWLPILEDELVLKKLILATPEELLAANDELFRRLFKEIFVFKDIRKRKRSLQNDQEKPKKNRKGAIKISDEENEALRRFDLIARIIDYNDWFNKLDANKFYGPYELATKLNMRSCTYCNRQYTLTVKSKSNNSQKLTRPQFDHWISKDDFPLLGLSFFNLIPSCPTCNSSVKGNTKLNTKDYIHPYLDNLVDYISFDFEYWNTLSEYRIKLSANHPDKFENNRIERTLKAFKLEEVYNGHQPELDDLVQLAKAYSPEYLAVLKKSFPGANLSNEQIYRLAFGTELNSTDFHKRPLSKFKHDILKELGIIPPK